MRISATSANVRRMPVALTAIALAMGIAACDRAPDKSASAKPELIPTPPAIGAPPANPAPVMPPSAATVMTPTGSDSTASTLEKTKPEQGTPVDSGGARPDPGQTAQGGDPTAKQPLTKEEESTAMPKPGQANDHSTTATDGKQ